MDFEQLSDGELRTGIDTDAFEKSWLLSLATGIAAQRARNASDLAAE